MSLPYFCHSCGNVVEPSNDFRCPICDSDFIEVYDSNNDILDSMFMNIGNLFTSTSGRRRNGSRRRTNIASNIPLLSEIEIENDLRAMRYGSNSPQIEEIIEDDLRTMGYGSSSRADDILEDNTENQRIRSNRREREAIMEENYGYFDDHSAEESIIDFHSDMEDNDLGQVTNDIENLLNRIRDHRQRRGRSGDNRRNSNNDSGFFNYETIVRIDGNGTQYQETRSSRRNEETHDSPRSFSDLIRSFFIGGPSVNRNIRTDRRNYAFGPEYEEILARLFEEGAPAQNPADQEFIKNLKKEKATGKGKCSICLVEYSDDEYGFMFKCGHFFHCDCMLEWLKIQNTCPVCRAVLEEL